MLKETKETQLPCVILIYILGPKKKKVITTLEQLGKSENIIVSM